MCECVLCAVCCVLCAVCCVLCAVCCACMFVRACVLHTCAFSETRRCWSRNKIKKGKEGKRSEMMEVKGNNDKRCAVHIARGSKR